MKSQIRILGIDDAAFDKFKDKTTIVIGTVFRGGDFLDGVLSCIVSIDGTDATTNIAEMVNNSKFKPQIRVIMLDGIAVAGFNVIDIIELHKLTDIPVIVVVRNKPDIVRFNATLVKLGMSEKIKLVKEAGSLHSYGDIYYQFYGLDSKDAEEILKLSITRSKLPEPIRVAHLIGAGLKLGESKGRA